MGTGSVFKGLTRRKRPRRLLWLAVALVLLLVPTIPTIAATSPVRETNLPGFGDLNNSYAWSMAWFKGKLYVGTVRDEECIEYATFAYYGITPYTQHPYPEMNCGNSIFDLDLRAEIWQYTPTSTSAGNWRRVYQSPVIPNPEAVGQNVAQFIGFRGMVVYTDPATGDQSLFVGSVTPDEYIPELRDTNPPRLLRSSDGEHFDILNGAPDRVYTVYDPVNGEKPIGYRAMVIYNNRLFVTSGSGLTGDGVVVEVGHPFSSNPTFTQVSPNGMQVFDMAVFNNQLYVGTGDTTNGYGVSRTSATGAAPYVFSSVVANGAGRGRDIISVVSMKVFDNRLYVGASGWYNTLFPASELIRVAPDDSWQVVVGNPRFTPSGLQFPISGLPDGFGNIFNAHFWRMEEFYHGLYLGTNDWSWLLRYTLLDPLISWEYGFDIYGSCDGQSWFLATQDAFGDGRYNFGARTMQSTPYGGFIGSANQVQGTVLFSTNGTEGVPQCAPFSISDFWNTPWGSIIKSIDSKTKLKVRTPSNSTDFFIPGADASRPKLLQADVQTQGTVLSWDPSQGAAQYEVFRAEYLPNSQVGVVPPKRLPNGMPGDLPYILPGASNAPAPTGVNILGPTVDLGQTSNPYFIDTTAAPGKQYAYSVKAVSSSSQVSMSSNLVVVPDDTQPVTFGVAINAINSLVAKGQLSQDSANSLIGTLNNAQIQNDQGNVQQSVQTLGTAISQVMPGSGMISDSVYAQGLAAQISGLQRRIALANVAGSETGAPINDGSVITTPPSNGGTPPSSGGTPPSNGGNSWSSLTNPLLPFGFPSIRNAW